jgi:hypothetical protein
MPTYDDYLAAIKGADPSLTDEQAKAMAKNRSSVQDAISARKATNEQKLADKKAEHDRVWAMRHKPGGAPKALPIYNAELGRWERP